MKLPTEFIQLPLRFDADVLAAEISRFAESDWRPHPQGHRGNSALPLIAAHGNPLDDSTRGPMRPTPHLDHCPYLQQTLAAFGTVLGRTRLMRLDGNSEATAHSDTNYYWLERVRIHVPVVTDPAVRFLCGDREVHMAPGEAWIFDTWKVHNVLNPNPTRRIHLVADSVGSAAFWQLVAAADGPPRHLAFDPQATPQLAFETVNQPVVMTPWEQDCLLGGLLAELAVSEARQAGLVAELRQGLDHFRREWRARWAQFGEGDAGWPAYQQLLDRLGAQLAPFERRLRLPNGADAVEIVCQMVVRPGLNPDLAPAAPAATTARPATVARATATVAPTARRFEQPVFIVSPPRAGSSLLFETLSQAPEVWTVGGESHAFIEGIPELSAARHDFASNRLTAEEAAPGIVERLERAFYDALRDRQGNRPPAGASALRFLEKTPKNALRVPFFARAFPDARFIYLYRDPRETVSSILDAWKSGRFVTYPQLPGWPGPPWSLLLVPGWRQLAGLPLAEIAARQWAATTEQLLADLGALPPDRWCVASYDQLVVDPLTEIQRLCAFADLRWDRPLTTPLPNSRHTLTSPEPEKWRHNRDELSPVMPLVAAVAERARELFAREPRTRPARPKAFAEGPRPALATAAPPATTPDARDPNAFRSVFTEALPPLLARLGTSLLVSTYQSGRVIAVRADGGSLNTHFRAFPSPMGMALGRRYLAIGTQRHLWEYRNQPEVGLKLPPAGKHDACFLPRRSHVTGDIRVHELAFARGDGAEEELWLVNTRFSCLSVLDADHSFVPRWQPRFVSTLRPEDRCHLNGLAVVGGRPRYVTALGESDTPQGWRERKADGGCVIDVAANEVVARGLSMPHSPRWHEGRLWVLESGKGEVGYVDLTSGKVVTVARLPGFTRGLAFAGPYAFVGLSQVRESNLFGGIPLAERVRERLCGVWVLDLRNGSVVGFLRFEGLVQEIFDLLLLPGIRFPELAEPDSDLSAGAFVLPAEALAGIAAPG